MHIHCTQETHEVVFDQSRSRTKRTGRPASGFATSVIGRTALQHARLAIITHIFAFLSLLCLDPPISAASVILSAFKVATTICQRGGGPENDSTRPAKGCCDENS